MKPLLPKTDLTLTDSNNASDSKNIQQTINSQSASPPPPLNCNQSSNNNNNNNNSSHRARSDLVNHDVAWLVGNCTTSSMDCHRRSSTSNSKQSIIRKSSSPLPASSASASSMFDSQHPHHNNPYGHHGYLTSRREDSLKCDENSLNNVKISTSARCLALETAYVHEVYAQIARSYGACSPIRSHIKEFIFDEFEYGSVIMDIGCGDGKYLNLNPGVIIIGLERCVDWFMSSTEFADTGKQQQQQQSNLIDRHDESFTGHESYRDSNCQFNDTNSGHRITGKKGNNQNRSSQSKRRSHHLSSLKQSSSKPCPRITTRRQSNCTSLGDRLESSQFLIGDIINVPIRDEILDGVLCCGVLHHISTNERRINALREISRLLKVGGKVLITVWAFEGRELGSQDVLIKWNSDMDSPHNKVNTSTLSKEQHRSSGNKNNTRSRQRTRSKVSTSKCHKRKQPTNLTTTTTTTTVTAVATTTTTTTATTKGHCTNCLSHHCSNRHQCKHQHHKNCHHHHHHQHHHQQHQQQQHEHHNRNACHLPKSKHGLYSKYGGGGGGGHLHESTITELSARGVEERSKIVGGCYINHLQDDSLDTTSSYLRRACNVTRKVKRTSSNLPAGGTFGKFRSSIGGSSGDESSNDEYNNLGYMSGDDDSSQASSRSYNSTSSSSIFINNSSDSSFANGGRGGGSSSSSTDDSSSDSSCSTTTTTYVNRRAAYESCNSPTSEYGSCYSFVKKALLRFNLGPAAAFYYTAAAAASATSGVVAHGASGSGGGGGSNFHTGSGGPGANSASGRRASHVSAGSGGRGDNTSCADIEDIPIELPSMDNVTGLFDPLTGHPLNSSIDGKFSLNDHGHHLPLRRNSTCSGMKKTYSGLQNHLPFRRKSTSGSLFSRNTLDKKCNNPSGPPFHGGSSVSLGRKNSLKESFVALFKDHLSFSSSKNNCKSHNNSSNLGPCQNFSTTSDPFLLEQSTQPLPPGPTGGKVTGDTSETASGPFAVPGSRMISFNCSSSSERLLDHRLSLPVVFENRSHLSKHSNVTSLIPNYESNGLEGVRSKSPLCQSYSDASSNDPRVRSHFNSRYHGHGLLTQHVTHTVPAVIDEVESRYEENSLSKQSSADVTLSDDRSPCPNSNSIQISNLPSISVKRKHLKKILHKSASSDSMDSLHVQQISHQTTTTDDPSTASIDSLSSCPKLSAYFSMPELRSIETQVPLGKRKRLIEPPVFRGRRVRPSIVDLHPITFLSKRKLSHLSNVSRNCPLEGDIKCRIFAVSSSETSTDVFLQQQLPHDSSLDTDFGSLDDSDSIFASMDLPTSPAAPTLTPTATTIQCDHSGTSTAVPFGSRLTNNSSRNGATAMDDPGLGDDLEGDQERRCSLNPDVAEEENLAPSPVHLELKTQRSCSVEYKSQVSPSHLSSMRRLSASPSLHIPKIISELRAKSGHHKTSWNPFLTSDDATTEARLLQQQLQYERASSQQQDHETHPSVDSEESFVTIIPADRSCRGSIDVTTARDIDAIDLDALGAAVSSSCAIDLDEDIDDDLDRAITATHNESDGGSFLDEVVLDMDAHDISDVDVPSLICGPVLGPGAICPPDYLRPPSKPVYPSRQESACLTPASICSNLSNTSSGKLDNSPTTATASKNILDSTNHRLMCHSSISPSSRTSSGCSGVLDVQHEVLSGDLHPSSDIILDALDGSVSKVVSSSKNPFENDLEGHTSPSNILTGGGGPFVPCGKLGDVTQIAASILPTGDQSVSGCCCCCCCTCGDCCGGEGGDTSKDSNDEDEDESSGTSTPSPPANLHRYFHLFRCGELEDLILNNVEHLHVVRSYYSEHATSWCVICEKIQVWTI